MSKLPAPNPAQLAEAKMYGQERNINPYIAILEEIARTAGHVAWLRMKVQEAPYDDALLETHLPWMRLYMNERDRLVKVSETAIRLGLEERVVRLEERKAEIMVRAFVAALAELGIPQESLELAPSVLRKHLLALETAAVEG